ncbi:MAG: hypothetical protein B6244_00510 [Candidatus Cloacimonetes bacterium 4572_55]|nr:MAG: hypothetical protein B6244_00510 [Candidatus Cloacimonetes bacterium 4572_55]
MRALKSVVFFVVIFLVFTASAVPAQINMKIDKKPVKIHSYLSRSALVQGESASILVICQAPKQSHLTENFNSLTPPDSSDFIFSDPVLPKGIVETDEDGEKETLFRGDIPFMIQVTAPEDMAPGEYHIELNMQYQYCSEAPSSMCFPPETKIVSITIPVSEKGTESHPANTQIFASAQQKLLKEGYFSSDNEPEDALPTLSEQSDGSDNSLANRVQNALESGSIWVFLLVFFGGFLTSLTPCVYPMIPITISYIGGRAKGKMHGFYLSLFFVLGIALMYSSLGVIAASTGALFGNALQNPIAVTIVALVFAAMGLSMFGLFDLALPASFQTKLQSKQRGGVIGAIVMGAVTGIVASPCVGPALVVLLTWVGQTGSLLLGFSLLFVFAVGMGMLFIIIGTFSGAMSALPQAGAWMDSVKHIFGVVLICMSVYYIAPIMPDATYQILVGSLLILLGSLFGAFRKMPHEEGVHWSIGIAKGFGIIALSAGIFYLILGLAAHHNVSFGSSHGQSRSEIGAGQHETVAWIMSEKEGLHIAKRENKPVMIDFYADWCAACVELDEKTWVVDSVKKESERFVNIKMDFTKTNASEVKEAQKRYEIKGMPTVIFLDQEGNEQLRFEGFKTAEQVLKIMEKVK